MLAIRMQRTGRKGHAEFRIIVQESRRTPTSGAVVAQLGHYNPHAKQTSLDKEKTGFYLEHGAQPSDSVVRILQKEGIKLPNWVKLASSKSRSTRHPEKLRKNQPEAPAVVAEQASETEELPAETPVSEVSSEETVVEADADDPTVSDNASEPVAEEVSTTEKSEK